MSVNDLVIISESEELQEKLIIWKCRIDKKEFQVNHDLDTNTWTRQIPTMIKLNII